MKKTTRIAFAAVMVLLLFSATGCRRVLIEDSRTSGSEAPTVSDSSEVSLEGAESLDASVHMGAGELMLSGGAPAGLALAAEFDYRPSEWEPRVTYATAGSTGELKVSQPPLDFHLGDTRNSWDLRLPSDVPVVLDLELGAGEGDIDLTGMMLERLELDLGAGEAIVDLSGEWSNDLEARIEAGVGRLEIRVPEDVGVRITGNRQGIGEFRAEGFSEDGDHLVNDAWDTAEYKLDIELNQGVGEIVVETVR